MNAIISAEDRRLTRRAAALFSYLCLVMEVLFVGGVVLPSVNAGGTALAYSVKSLGPGILASLIFAALLAGASMFVPEKPLPPYTRIPRSFLGLALGVIAIAIGGALLLAPPFYDLAASVEFWILLTVALLNCILGAFFAVRGFRDLQAALPEPAHTAP